MSKLRPGDRVQLAQLGELRNPRKSARAGTILAPKSCKSGAASVVILFDGTTKPSRMHRTYVQRIERPAKGRV